jgi:hypothetical protein
VRLERVPLSLVSTIEELLGRKSSGAVLEIRKYGRGDPLRWPFYRQNLALTCLTSGGRSVGIVRSRTKATEFFILRIIHIFIHKLRILLCVSLIYSISMNYNISFLIFYWNIITLHVSVFRSSSGVYKIWIVISRYWTSCPPDGVAWVQTIRICTV